MLRSNYEKVICACCFLALFVNVGFTSTSFNVYQPYLADLIGHEAASNVLLFRTLISLGALFLVGRWYDLVDCKVGVIVASVLTASGFVVFSFARDFVMFCLAGILVGIGYGFGGMVAVTLLVGRWFNGKVGTAMGIVAAGSSCAGILLPILATYIIQNLGLPWAFRLEALLALGVALVLSIFLKNRPSDLGLEPYEGKSGNSKKTARAISSHRLSSFQRRLMVFAMVLMGCIAVDGWNYLSVLMTHSGFEAYFAAVLLTFSSVAMVAGKLSTGMVFDKVGVMKGSAIFFSLLIAGLSLCSLAFLHNSVVMIAGALILGFGISLGTVGISVWSIDLSEPLQRTKLVKDFQVAYAFGGFVFNLIPGRVVEAGGSYSFSFAVLAIFCVIEAAIVVGIYLRKRKQQNSIAS